MLFTGQDIQLSWDIARLPLVPCIEENVPINIQTIVHPVKYTEAPIDHAHHVWLIRIMADRFNEEIR